MKKIYKLYTCDGKFCKQIKLTIECHYFEHLNWQKHYVFISGNMGWSPGHSPINILNLYKHCQSICKTPILKILFKIQNLFRMIMIFEAEKQHYESNINVDYYNIAINFGGQKYFDAICGYSIFIFWIQNCSCYISMLNYNNTSCAASADTRIYHFIIMTFIKSTVLLRNAICYTIQKIIHTWSWK